MSHRARRFPVIALALALTAAGCGTSDETAAQATPQSAGTAESALAATPGTTVITEPSQAPATTAAPIDPCAGAADDCLYVADVDVDGDGVSDQVGVAYGPSGAEVIVGINGQPHKWTYVLSSTLWTDPADLYRGAYLLSRPAGVDIVLHLVPGQGNSEQFAVISWDGAGLVALPEPPTADAQGEKSDDVWYLSSSHGRQESIRCDVPGEITLSRLTAAVAEGMAVPGGGRREDNYYRYDGGEWLPNGSDNVADASLSYSWDAHTQAFDCTDLGVAPR